MCFSSVQFVVYVLYNEEVITHTVPKLFVHQICKRVLTGEISTAVALNISPEVLGDGLGFRFASYNIPVGSKALTYLVRVSGGSSEATLSQSRNTCQMATS